MPLRLLLAGFRERTLASSFVLSCGTVPLLTHGFRFGSKFSAKISGGPLRRVDPRLHDDRSGKNLMAKPEHEFFPVTQIG